MVLNVGGGIVVQQGLEFVGHPDGAFNVAHQFLLDMASDEPKRYSYGEENSKNRAKPFRFPGRRSHMFRSTGISLSFRITIFSRELER